MYPGPEHMEYCAVHSLAARRGGSLVSVVGDKLWVLFIFPKDFLYDCRIY